MALIAAEADPERALEALKPLAAIKLWRDHYPDGPDILADTRLGRYFTVAEVRAAREAIGVVG